MARDFAVIVSTLKLKPQVQSTLRLNLRKYGTTISPGHPSFMHEHKESVSCKSKQITLGRRRRWIKVTTYTWVQEDIKKQALLSIFSFKQSTYSFQVETNPVDSYVATTCLGKVTKKWQTSTVQGGTYQSPTFQIAKRNRGKSTELKTWVNKFTHQNTGKVYQIGNKLSPQKYSAVVKAHQLATLMLQDAVTTLENKKYNNLYTRWFGRISTCQTQVKDNFCDFLRQAKDEEFFYQVLPDELGKEGWMAAVDGMLTGKEQ